MREDVKRRSEEWVNRRIPPLKGSGDVEKINKRSF
jgi:hypothetical protein